MSLQVPESIISSRVSLEEVERRFLTFAQEYPDLRRVFSEFSFFPSTERWARIALTLATWMVEESGRGVAMLSSGALAADPEEKFSLTKKELDELFVKKFRELVHQPAPIGEKLK